MLIVAYVLMSPISWSISGLKIIKIDNKIIFKLEKMQKQNNFQEVQT